MCHLFGLGIFPYHAAAMHVTTLMCSSMAIDQTVAYNFIKNLHKQLS